MEISTLFFEINIFGMKAPKCDKYNRSYFANVSVVYQSDLD